MSEVNELSMEVAGGNALGGLGSCDHGGTSGELEMHERWDEFQEL